MADRPRPKEPPRPDAELPTEDVKRQDSSTPLPIMVTQPAAPLTPILEEADRRQARSVHEEAEVNPEYVES